MTRIVLALGALLAWTGASFSQQVLPPVGTAALVCAYNSSIPSPASGTFAYVQCDSFGKLITSGGGSSTITANSTPTSGFTAGELLYSDGSLVQASPAISDASGNLAAKSLKLNGATLPTNGILAGNYSPGANTATPGESISNINVASSGNQQYACSQLAGQGWKTTATPASQSVIIKSCVIPIQGTSAPLPGWELGSIVNGGSLSDIMDWNVSFNNDLTVTVPVFVNQDLEVSSAFKFFFNNGTQFVTPSARNLQFGGFDSASPSLQVLSFQSVVAGTSNAAGALAKFLDSAGTGTGASGGFEWDTHPLGSSGTAQNAAALALAINSAGTFTLDTAIYASCTALTTNGSGVLGCTASDPRLKNIDRAPYSGGLKDVLRITPISFRGKPGNEENVDTRHQAGFNCWNVRDSLPLATHEDGRGYCNLDPEALVAALYNAVKEQQTEIAAIRREIRK